MHRIRTLLDFYAARSSVLFLVGLAALGLRLFEVGPSTIFSLIAIIGVGVGLPLRLHAQNTRLNTLLEEERQITHGRLSKLENGDR